MWSKYEEKCVLFKPFLFHDFVQSLHIHHSQENICDSHNMGLFWIIVGKVLQNPILGLNLPIFHLLNGNISYAISIFGDFNIQYFSCEGVCFTSNGRRTSLLRAKVTSHKTPLLYRFHDENILNCNIFLYSGHVRESPEVTSYVTLHQRQPITRTAGWCQILSNHRLQRKSQSASLSRLEHAH